MIKKREFFQIEILNNNHNKEKGVYLAEIIAIIIKIDIKLIIKRTG